MIMDSVPMDFEIAYASALYKVIHYGMESAPRGMKVKELLGYQFTIDPTDNVIKTIGGFHTNLEYAQEELQWYLSGTNRIDFSPLIEKTWKKYSDDGETVNSAYGHYLFSTHVKMDAEEGQNYPYSSQWLWVLNKLREDPDSRQCVMNINQVYHKNFTTKDFPCTIACQVFIRQGKLFWITYMRSQDLFYGTRNDVYCFTELQKKMATELGVGLGTYTHVMGSMHLYEKHWELAKVAVE